MREFLTKRAGFVPFQRLSFLTIVLLGLLLCCGPGCVAVAAHHTEYYLTVAS